MDRQKLLYLFALLSFISCNTTKPRIDCFDPNDLSADTSYFVNDRYYSGFIFPESYKPMMQVSDIRFTPTLTDVETAENILKTKVKHGKFYRRQYIGYINLIGDSLVYIRLVKHGFEEECFDKIVVMGFGDFYEKNQRKYDINLTTKEIK